MLIIYNILQLLALLLLWPWLGLWLLFSTKYRSRVPRRLGLGLQALVKGLRPGPRIWLHALSVGEVASARPLLAAMRREMPEAVIILSTTTSGGEACGRGLGGLIDCLIPFPLDLSWVAAWFVKVVRPSLFVLVETDFWPNLLACLAREKVPALLVNGRITKPSMALYQRGRLLFAPLFASFHRISMQMAEDADRLASLGVAADTIVTCGNLKYDLAGTMAALPAGLELRECGLIGRPLLVAGSTHPGEEELLLDALQALGPTFPDLAMVIAPRRVERAREVVALANRRGLVCNLRTASPATPCQVLILDTLGELAQVYRQADLAFVGGSLVAAGGHNPLEPAFFAKPVLFGPDMSDFAEISRDLLVAGGAEVVTASTLPAVLAALLTDNAKRRRMGQAAGTLIAAHQGAADRCLALIKEALGHDR